jgi:hypothetical protein
MPWVVIKALGIKREKKLLDMAYQQSTKRTLNLSLKVISLEYLQGKLPG